MNPLPPNSATKTQRIVLRAFVDFLEEVGVPPTVQELATRVGRSRERTREIIGLLIRRKLLSRLSSSRVRSVIVTDKGREIAARVVEGYPLPADPERPLRALTEGQSAEALRLIEGGVVTLREAAGRFGVCRETIRRERLRQEGLA